MAEVSPKGTIHIAVEDNGLKAVATVSPGDDPLSENAVKDFLKKEGIKEGIRAAGIKELLQKAASADERVSVILAEGTPPIPPDPPEVKWEEFPIPQEIQAEAAKSYKNSGPPEIFIIKTQKIKKEERIEKKGRFPFGKQKEQTRVYYETREHKEKVYINPHIVKKGYAESGQKLGTVAPGKTGTPGKDVYGMVVLPREKSSGFYAGNGVQQEKGILTAVESGFIRIGKNWIDIIPFHKHEWTVSLSRDKNTCLIDFVPGAPAALPPSPEDVLARAENLGYDRSLLVSAQEIQHLLAEAVRNQTELKGESISTTEDSFFSVEATPDKLKGLLTIRKHRGSGIPLVLKDVGAEIKKSGLKGLDFDKIKSAILEFYKGPEPVLDSYVLCEGKPPGEGEKQEIENDVIYLSAREREQVLSLAGDAGDDQFPGIESLEEFPIGEVKDLALVMKDQPVAHITPATKGENGVDVFGSQIEGIPGPELDLHLFENIKHEKNMLISTVNGILDYSKEEESYYYRVRPHRDAGADVSVSEDRMSAMISLVKEEGTGRSLTREMVDEALAEAGVVQGIDSAAVEEAVRRALEGQEVTEFTVASGKPPVNPGEKKLEFRIEFASGKGVTIGESGKADFRRQDRITNVDAGTLIAELIGSDDAAEDGWDVMGRTIAAKSIKSEALIIGNNIEEKELENGTRQFYSTVQGEVTFEKKKLEVRSVHKVPGDVDMKSGNVKFSGDISVKGNVTSGFVVFSGGRIRIGQGVDAALLSAEGSITIGGGIKGSGKAVIRTKDTVTAGFAEQTNILAVGDVHFTKSCFRCNIKTNGKVILSGDKGTLVGGIIKTRRGLSVKNLGADTGIKTTVSFGQNYLVQDQIEAEERELQKYKNNMVKIDLLMKKLEKSNDKPRLAKARHEKLKFMKMIEKRSMRLFTLREKFEEHFPSEIEVRGNLYPGVVFESHGRYHEIDSVKTNIVLTFDQKTGHIIETAGKKGD